MPDFSISMNVSKSTQVFYRTILSWKHIKNKKDEKNESMNNKLRFS